MSLRSALIETVWARSWSAVIDFISSSASSSFLESLLSRAARALAAFFRALRSKRVPSASMAVPRSSGRGLLRSLTSGFVRCACWFCAASLIAS
jgi:hypothetical protein